MAKDPLPPWNWADADAAGDKDLFFGSQIRNRRHQVVDGGLEVTATLLFTFPRDRNYEYHWDYLIPKIGIRIADAERADLRWGSAPERAGVDLVAIRPLADFVTELGAFFGREPGTQWVAFAPDERTLVQPTFPQPYTGAWTVRLRLTPPPKAYRLLPVVFKHYRVPFSARHLTGLWEIPVA